MVVVVVVVVGNSPCIASSGHVPSLISISFRFCIVSIRFNFQWHSMKTLNAHCDFYFEFIIVFVALR